MNIFEGVEIIFISCEILSIQNVLTKIGPSNLTETAFAVLMKDF